MDIGTKFSATPWGSHFAIACLLLLLILAACLLGI